MSLVWEQYCINNSEAKISPFDTVAEEVIMWEDGCISPPSDWEDFLAVRDILSQLFYRCSGCFLVWVLTPGRLSH